MSATQPRFGRRSQIKQVISRHKGKAVLIPALSILAATLVILFCPRTYHSEAVLFLQVGRESVGIDPTAAMGQTISLQQSGRDDEVKSAIDILRSRGVLGKTVDRLTPEVVLGEGEHGSGETNALASTIGSVMGTLGGIVASVDPISKREKAIIELGESLVIESERGSTAIEVEIESETPELAQQLLTELIAVYSEEHARIYRNQNSQAFFKDQMDELEKKLDAAKEAMRDKKNELGIASITARRETLEGTLLAIELERTKTEQELASANARVADLKQQLGNLPERVATATKTMPNEGADMLRQALYDLEIRKADLTARYADNHPLVVAINDQVEAAKKVVDAQDVERHETIDDVNPIHQQLMLTLKEQQSLVAGYVSRLELITGQAQQIKQDLNLLNDTEIALYQLEREVLLRESEFFKYAENFEQARIDQELEANRISNVSMLQEPLLLEKPVSPSKSLVVLAALFLATAGTAAAILASEKQQEAELEAERELNSDSMSDSGLVTQAQGKVGRRRVLTSK